jgi:Rad3-related DNA helicase
MELDFEISKEMKHMHSNSLPNSIYAIIARVFLITYQHLIVLFSSYSINNGL